MINFNNLKHKYKNITTTIHNKNNLKNIDYLPIIKDIMSSYYPNKQKELNNLFKKINIIKTNKDSYAFIKNISSKYNLNYQEIKSNFITNNILSFITDSITICISSKGNLPLVKILEYLICEINFIFNNKNKSNKINIRYGIYNSNRYNIKYKKNYILKEIINILQTEEIMKILLRKYNLQKNYKCLIYQAPVNLIRPLYQKHNLNNLSNNTYLNEISLLLNKNDSLIIDINNKNKTHIMYNNYCKIKDLVFKLCTEYK